MNIREMAQRSWDTEGVRHLENGCKCPTPEERYILGFINGCIETELKTITDRPFTQAEIEEVLE
jgi:hypothetical protein